MTFKVIKLHPDRLDFHKCEALLNAKTREYWGNRSRVGNEQGSDYCTTRAVYKIGPRFYCHRHAAAVVLEALVEYESYPNAADRREDTDKS